MRPEAAGRGERGEPVSVAAMKTILTPVDFSSASDDVIREASALARALGGRIVVLTVIQPPVITSEYSPMMENFAAITAAGEEAATTRLQRITRGLQAKSIPHATLRLHGAPVAHIVEQAKKLSADYIVMGSHGHNAVYDLLVGTTTHGVLMRAACPVMIVPQKKTRARRKRK